MKHTTVRLPDSRLRKAKSEAAKAGTTLQELLARGLDLALAELRTKERAA